MSNLNPIEDPPRPLPFSPEPPRQLARRYRRALAPIFTPEAVERREPDLDPAQVFDFSGGVRLVLSVQEAPDQKLLLCVVGEAWPGARDPLREIEMPLVLWHFQQISPLQVKPLHLYYDGYRVHITFPAPAEAGTPEPPPPVQAMKPAPDSTKIPSGLEVIVNPKPVSFEVDIPPGLTSYSADPKLAKRIETP